MLEETNDNLPMADGNPENQSQEMVVSENQVVETVSDVENEVVLVPDTEVEAPIAAEAVVDVEDLVGEEVVETQPEVNVLDAVLEQNEIQSELVEDQKTELIETLANEELVDETQIVEAEQNDAMQAIAEQNAAESEDETIKSSHEVEMQDYDALSMEDLIAELEKLTAIEKVMSVKDHVEGVKNAFLQKYYHFIDEKKEAFEAEKGDSNEDFQYTFPLKAKFDQLYSSYRDRKNAHFNSLKTNLETNLKTRIALVEELKNLVHAQENIPNSLKVLNDIRDRWKNAGAIPKDKYNHVWNNFHFHIENFYDILHLDREARDLDFKHNLVLKQKIIERCEELVNETDVNKAFRELQDLHKIWKEDIGPVSRDHREEIWNKFSDLTKQMHDKRELIFESLRANETENLEKKKEIIAQIAVLAQEKVDSHNLWGGQVAKVEALRETFFATGKVPNEVNEETWKGFKDAVKEFNFLKNSFYKDIKKEQSDNLQKKQALVNKARELQESTDYAATTPILKQIQEEWKTIGHVPRNVSDKLWKQFREACNHYFEKLKEQKTEENADEVAAFEKKKVYMETMRTFEMTGEHKTDLDAIKLHIETWKSFGRVPAQRRHIEGKFNKILDALFEKLSVSKKDSEMMRFANRMEQFSDSNDTRKLENEKVFLMRKIEEVQGEIFQLENNIQFFTNTKNAKKENSIVLEVRKNIEKHREELVVLREKLKQLRTMKQE
jgi:hypothetical protein